MSDYKIEKGIPIQPRPYSRYPFAQMEIGDSFKVSREEALGLRKSAYYLGKRYGFKVSIRKVSKDEFRVWRVDVGYRDCSYGCKGNGHHHHNSQPQIEGK